MCLPCNLHDEADLHAGVLVCAAETVHYEEPLGRELLESELLEDFPVLLGERVVVVLVLVRSPPYGVLGVLVHHDVLVLRGTSGVDTGHHVDGTELGYLTFLIAGEIRPCLLVEENLVRWIVKDFFHALDSILA